MTATDEQPAELPPEPPSGDEQHEPPEEHHEPPEEEQGEAEPEQPPDDQSDDAELEAALEAERQAEQARLRAEVDRYTTRTEAATEALATATEAVAAYQAFLGRHGLTDEAPADALDLARHRDALEAIRRSDRGPGVVSALLAHAAAQQGVWHDPNDVARHIDVMGGPTLSDYAARLDARLALSPELLTDLLTTLATTKPYLTRHTN